MPISTLLCSQDIILVHLILKCTFMLNAPTSVLHFHHIIHISLKRELLNQDLSKHIILKYYLTI